MNQSASRPEELERLHVPRLIDGLRRLAEPPERADRAALAALRRGLGKKPGEAPEMFPVLLRLLPVGPMWRRHTACAYTIASLFAMHPESWDGPGNGRWSRNLGASLRQLQEGPESGGPERRVVSLLNSKDENLPEHLRGIVSLLRSRQVPVDWKQLAYDILQWTDPEREVQQRWATAFWGQPNAPSRGSPPGKDEE